MRENLVPQTPDRVVSAVADAKSENCEGFGCVFEAADFFVKKVRVGSVAQPDVVADGAVKLPDIIVVDPYLLGAGVGVIKVVVFELDFQFLPGLVGGPLSPV